jgi:hypothetical protein
MANGRGRQDGQFAGRVRQLCEMWWQKTNEDLDPAIWDRVLIGWIKQFNQAQLADAIQRVVAKAIWNKGSPNILDVPYFAKVLQADDREPGMGNCYFVRGAMRKKYYRDDEGDKKLLALLAEAMRRGVSADEMYTAVEENDNLRDCLGALGIDPKDYEGLGRQSSKLIFVRGDTPAFKMWDDQYRKETGRGVPLNSRFGWYSLPNSRRRTDHRRRRDTALLACLVLLPNVLTIGLHDQARQSGAWAGRRGRKV